MKRQRGFSRGQWFILAFVSVTLAGVLIGLISMVRQEAPNSPLATVAAHPTRLPTPSPPAPTATAVATEEVSTTQAISGPAVAPEVLAARRVDAMGREVGQLRELPKRQEIVLNFLSEQELADVLRRIRDDPERQTMLARRQAVLAALGLIPHSGERFPTTVQTRARHLLAFYDPVQNQIFLGPAVLDQETPDLSLIHQYAHALVDQHFDLLALQNKAANADAAQARDALMEGDATMVLALRSFGGLQEMDLEAWAEHLAGSELTDYEGYPTSQAMQALQHFPYADGARFVQALLQTNWWPAVNNAYLDPPASTEQILHPQKYLSTPRDEPRPVLLPDFSEDLGEDWHLVAQEVMGELVLRTHLDYYLPDSSEAAQAAAGWGGDLAAVWRDLDGREVLVMRILWDDADEAIQFVESYAMVVARRLGQTSRVIRPIVPAGGRWWRGEQGDAFLRRDKDGVLIIWAPDGETLERVLATFVLAE
jgi:hypothetical protein